MILLVPSRERIQNLINNRDFNSLFKEIGPFLDSYAQAIKDIIRFLDSKSIINVIIPEMGAVPFMRLIQAKSGNKFRMYPAPMSGNINYSKYLRNELKNVIIENLGSIRKTKVLRLALIDEIISGSSIKKLKNAFKNEMWYLLNNPLRRIFGGSFDFFEELKGFTIEFYSIGVVDLLKSWFTKGTFKAFTFLGKSKLKSDIEHLINEWSDFDNPIIEFNKLSKEYEEKLIDTYLNNFDNKIKPSGVRFSKNGSVSMKKLGTGYFQSGNDVLINCFDNIFFVVSLLFTEDVPGFKGVKHVKVDADNVFLLRDDNELFNKFKNEILNRL